MAASDIEVQLKVSDGEEAVIGQAVKIGIRRQGSTHSDYNQMWNFTSDGFIACATNPDYLLTAVKDFEINIVEKPKPGTPEAPKWDIHENQENGSIVVQNHGGNDEYDDYDDKFDTSSSSSGSDSEGESSSLFGKQKKKKKKFDDDVSAAQPETVIGHIEVAEDPLEKLSDVFGGEKISLIVLPRFPKNNKLLRNQRLENFHMVFC